MTGRLRRPTNISLPVKLVAEARELGINISQACERSLVVEVKAECERRWKEKHREAIEAHNAWVEQNGLPLADLRQF